MKRLFLVGCPRSGTTLLQSLLGSHPEIASFPESHFFNHLFAHSEPKRRRLGLVSRRAKPSLLKFLKESGCDDYRLPAFIFWPSQLTREFSKVLDQLAAQQEKTIWIEKTPTHLYHLDYIAQYIKQSKFIHIIRKGEDTVASLYDVRKKYPKQWANEPASVELSVDRWINDVSISLQYADMPNHLLVSYEDLVADTQLMLAQICQFVGVAFVPEMLVRYSAIAQKVSLAREPWKAGVVSPIHNANSTKFYSLFNASEQEYILQRTKTVDLSKMPKLPISRSQNALIDAA